MGCLNTVMNTAVREEIIPENPIKKLAPGEKVKVPVSQRDYLTIEEAELLAKTPCDNDLCKRAFMFACYCGLRLGDIYTLKWNDITNDGDKKLVSIVMGKTRKPIYIPLSKKALA